MLHERVSRHVKARPVSRGQRGHAVRELVDAGEGLESRCGPDTTDAIQRREHRLLDRPEGERPHDAAAQASE